jgi:hypothetical protein
MNFIARILPVLLLASTTTVMADGPHFTLTIPVELTNLPPETTSLQVYCSVTNAAGRSVPGHVTHSVTGGSFRGEVSVPITIPVVHNPADFETYRCSLHLQAALAGGGAMTLMSDAATGFPLAAGAPYVRHVTGSLRR